MAMLVNILCFILSSLFICYSFFADGPKIIEIIRARSLLLQNQSRFLDDLTREPLQERHQFYIYNITSSEPFSQSDDTAVVVDEVGPFSYYAIDSNKTDALDGHVRPLNLRDLLFRLNESVADESVFVYSLNIQLIRNLTSESDFLKSPDGGRNLVHKTTVRDALREILDGLDTTDVVDPSPETEWVSNDRRFFDDLPDDVSSSVKYLQYLGNEICTRLFKVIRFVNPPTHALFDKVPCECLTITPNGTESIPIKYPHFYKYPEVRTSKYLFQWNDELCARGPFIPNQQNRSGTGNIFWISSPAYWRDKSSVRYHPVVEEANETWIKVEPMSDVVTDFLFQYQLSLPLKIVDGKSSRDVMDIYPVLLTVTSGVSGKQAEESYLRLFLYPKKVVVSALGLLGIFATVFVISALLLGIPLVRDITRRRDDDDS